MGGCILITSKDIRSGSCDAAKEAIKGFIISVFLGFIPLLPFIPTSCAWVFQLLELVILIGNISKINKMESWGIGYLTGWLLTTWIIYSVGLADPWLILFVIVGAVCLIDKIPQKVEESLKKTRTEKIDK